MFRSLSAVSVAALLLASPNAFAQSQQPDTAAGGDATQMEMNKNDAAETRPDSAETRPDSAETRPDRPPSAERQVEQRRTGDDASTREVAGQIVLQDNDTFLASDLMNTNVHSSTAKDAEAVGDVNDIIFAKSGEVQGVVIGVGGFLGIGEKNVAIKMDRIQLHETESGIQLILETTKEDLEKAPQFKTKSAQRAEARAENARRDANARMKNPGMTPAVPERSEDQSRDRTNEGQKKTY